MMMMMLTRYGTDKLIQLLVDQSPAVYHYILYFQDMFSFALNPATLGITSPIALAGEGRGGQLSS